MDLLYLEIYLVIIIVKVYLVVFILEIGLLNLLGGYRY